MKHLLLLIIAAALLLPPTPSGAAEGVVVGEGCYAHYQEGASWPQVIDDDQGVVTCRDNFYYFVAARPVVPAPPVRGLGRVIGAGCHATHAEGDTWPQILAGMEGVVTCSGDAYQFWPVRYAPPVKHPLLNRSTLLCYYGNRITGAMGILGRHSLEEVERRLREQAAAYDHLNGDLGVTPCLDYVYLVANQGTHPYSHYTPGRDLFLEALEFARQQDMPFFIDLQLGYRDVEQEVLDLLPFLMEPHVHLALDTEFYMARTGGVPGERLGSMDAQDVNRATRLVQRLIEEHGLSDKIVQVYQFDPRMLTSKHLLDTSLPNVTVLVNADGVGYGGVAGKLVDYTQYAGEPRDALGIKLFLEWDAPLAQPAEVMALDPQPNQVVYQ